MGRLDMLFLHTFSRITLKRQDWPISTVQFRRIPPSENTSILPISLLKRRWAILLQEISSSLDRMWTLPISDCIAISFCEQAIPTETAEESMTDLPEQPVTTPEGDSSLSVAFETRLGLCEINVFLLCQANIQIHQSLYYQSKERETFIRCPFSSSPP